MTMYKEILKEDYCQRLFHQFLYTTALNNRQPFKAIQYDIDDMDTMLIVFSYTTRGTVSTKQFKLDKAEMFFFLQWLSEEFPDIAYKKVVEDDEEDK